MNQPNHRDILLDVSRLIWRGWAQRLPTGIDRVCLAYLEHFRTRARAVVQRKRLRLILSARDSDRLFDLLLKGEAASRLEWILLGLKTFPSFFRIGPADRLIYLNVGHTGLDEPSLPGFVAENRLRAVYMVHDLIPLTHPQFCREGEAAKHAKRVRHMLASASGIIGNSQATLDELDCFARRHGRALPPTIAALIAGHRALCAPGVDNPDRPYFVVVGTIEARKNHMLLLRIWRSLVEELGDAAPKLVIVGQRGWKADAALAILDNLAELEGHVTELGSVDDSELASLIAGARALLMPSFAEGFGLPVIEALQQSTPVIAGDLSVYRELAGEIPTYLHPQDEVGWMKTILDFLTECPERERQLEAMRSYVAPSWPAHFHRVDAWLEQNRCIDWLLDSHGN